LSKDQFPLDRTFKNGFIYFAPAISYTVPFPEKTTEQRIEDTTYSITSIPGGKVSFGLEMGWYHSFENPIFFHYLELGAAYRSFRGSSEVELTKAWDQIEITGNDEGDYNLQTASVLVRAVRATQLGKFTFLTYGPGLNFDYHLNDNRAYASEIFDTPEQEMKLQAHFQLGLGIRMTEKVIFLPQIEVPILEAYPTGKWEASQAYTENNLYPLLFSFKIILLREDLMNCNAPPAPKGF